MLRSGCRELIGRDRNPSNVAEVELEVDSLRWDALDIAGHQEFFSRVIGDRGPIDVVICAVGMLGHHSGLSMTPAELDLMTRTNYVGPAAALAAIARLLRHQGHGTIVVLSSVAAARARRSNYVYGSAKAGLDTYAQGLGDALADTPVCIVVVRAGFVRSRMTAGLEPAPFSRSPHEVARSIVRAINGERTRVVWVPAILGPLLGVLRLAPRPLWRRIAGDR